MSFTLARSFQRPVVRAFQATLRCSSLRCISQQPRFSSVSYSSSSTSSTSSTISSAASSVLNAFKKKEVAKVQTTSFEEFTRFAEDASYESVEKVNADDAEQFTPENFNLVMEGLLEAGSYSHVADVFLLMLLKGVEPNYKSWGLVVQAYKENGNTEDLENLALQVAAIRDMKPEQKQASLKFLAAPVTDAEVADFQKVQAEVSKHDPEQAKEHARRNEEAMAAAAAAAKQAK